MKPLMCAATLAMATFAVAYAKSYDITLDSMVKAGPTQIKAGEYSVKVKGNTAIFKSTDGKTYSAPVKVEADKGRKHEATAVVVGSENGGQVLKSIEVGGSHTIFEFQQ